MLSVGGTYSFTEVIPGSPTPPVLCVVGISPCVTGMHGINLTDVSICKNHVKWTYM